MRKLFVNYNLKMTLEQESFKQIYIHKGLRVHKKKEADLIKKCGLGVIKGFLVECHHLLYRFTVFKHRHVVLIHGSKKNVAIAVLCL